MRLQRFKPWTGFARMLVLGAALVTGTAQASPNFSRAEVLRPTTPLEGADFGRVVTGTYDNPSGPIAVTSRKLPTEQEPGGPGVVYVFEPKPGGGWLQKSRYTYIPEAALFGETLAITLQQLIVGTPNFGGDSGLVNVYELVDGEVSGLQPPALIQRLHPEVAGGEEFFGTALDLRRNLLVIGAPGSENNTESKVYVYRAVDGLWHLEQILRQPHPRTSDRGRTLATDGHRIAATGANGAAFVYVRAGNEWIVEQQFDRFTLGSGNTEGMFQASAIGVDGDWVAISTPGKIHMFHHKNKAITNPWQEVQSLDVPVPVLGFPFESSHELTFSGNRLLVGIPSETRAVIYELKNGMWRQQRVLAPDGSASGMEFGRSVDFGPARALVGAQGSAYVFR